MVESKGLDVWSSIFRFFGENPEVIPCKNKCRGVRKSGIDEARNMVVSVFCSHTSRLIQTTSQRNFDFYRSFIMFVHITCTNKKT